MLRNLFYFLFFILVLVFFRLAPHPPNFTPIIASAIMGPIFLKDRITGSAIPIFAMFISDAFIGFHPYQFIVYSTLISISIFSVYLRGFLSVIIFSIIGSSWFYLTTNFSVWLIWDYYPKNLEGLLSCYIMAIPFFTNTLISSILFVSLFYYSKNILEQFQNYSFNFFNTIKK